MAKTSATYELMYIIDLDKGEDGIAALVEKFQDLIEDNGGEIIEHEEMGKRKLAYLINDKPEGYYVLVKFNAEPQFPAELDRILKITDGIMRSLITVIGE
ncbi:MAG: 30S ribosomal protein S6 [Ruminococcaceae bacterium]|nr:30S ribosomal protein S6 [Oscillospiraceae bacterium]MBE6948356.1 30S ribosomal protein S6 [Oscillospiraceae bacterium]